MAILAGVDLVDIARIERMVQKGGDAFVASIWSSAEVAYSAGRFDRLATRWGAKEAAMKALGRGLGRIDPLDIEVLTLEGEAPQLALRGSALQRAQELRAYSWSLSLSHESGFALAYVIASTKDL